MMNSHPRAPKRAHADPVLEVDAPGSKVMDWDQENASTIATNLTILAMPCGCAGMVHKILQIWSVPGIRQRLSKQ